MIKSIRDEGKEPENIFFGFFFMADFREKRGVKISKKMFKILLNSLTNIGKRAITEVSMLSAKAD